MTIVFERCHPVAVAYAVLARLDLGRDAANLHDPSLPKPRWADELLAAYREAPGRLTVHGLPLTAGDELQRTLRERPPSSLGDAAGRALARRFADAMDDLATEAIAWSDPPDELIEVWTTLRSALWEKKGGAPAWRLYDAPALRWAGRAIRTVTEQRIAVAFDRPAHHIACQVFHEACHAITDPLVASPAELAKRSTSAATSGFQLHRALEDTAVEVGQAVIEARAPELVEAYERWRGRFS